MLKRFQRFFAAIGSGVVIFFVAVQVNAYQFDTSDERVFTYGEGQLVIVLPTVRPSGGWALPTLTRTSGTFMGVELFEYGQEIRTGIRALVRKGLGPGIQGFHVFPAMPEIHEPASTELDVEVTHVLETTFENTFAGTVIPANAERINIRLTGRSSGPSEGNTLGIAALYGGIRSRSQIIFCDSAKGERVTHCGLGYLTNTIATLNSDLEGQLENLDFKINIRDDLTIAEMARDTVLMQLAAAQEQIRTLTGDRDATQAQLVAAQARVTQLIEQLRGLDVEPVPAATGGGSSGGGAIGAVAIAASAFAWWKKQNPTSKLNFAVMPTDTDAYVAEFNATPRENMHFNLRFTEGNLFATNDIVKPETNSTVRATVKWTW